MYLNFDAASAAIILSLNSMNAQLNQTETELSTGNAINSPADNPVVWAEAASEQSDAGGWGAVENDIAGANSPEFKTATSALSTVLSTLDDMQTTVEDAQASGDDDTTTALSTLQEYGKTLKATVLDAVSSNGVNLLDGSTGSVSFIDGYGPTGSVQTSSFTTTAVTGNNSILQDANASGTAMDLTALTDDDLSSGTIASTLENIKGAIADVASYSASLGGVSTAETTMQTNLQDGVDDLIGANLSTLSVRETALQTQIQLATQALSISAQSSQLVLKLFE
jgi:flagellin